MMIIYNGIKSKDKVYFLCFKNEKNDQVEIPMDAVIANRISLYLNKLGEPVMEINKEEENE